MAETGNKKIIDSNEKDTAKGREALGDRQVKMKEDEHMPKNQDPEAVKKTEEKAAETSVGRSADKPAAPQKKKNIIQVFRPQNSKTGMVKPGSRPKPQGAAGGRRQGQAAGARPQGATAAGARPQGTAAAGARPQGTAAAGARPQGARPQGTAAAGTAAGARPQGTAAAGTVAGVRPQESAAAGVRPQGTAAAGVKPQGAQAAEEVRPQTEIAEGKTPNSSSTATGVKSQTAAAAAQNVAQSASGDTEKSQRAGNTAAGVKTPNGENAAAGVKAQNTANQQADVQKEAAVKTPVNTVKETASEAAEAAKKGNSRQNADGRRDDGARNQGGRSGRSQDSGNRSQGGYNRNQDGGNRGSQGGYNRNQDGGSRGSQGGYNRSQDGGSRGGQGGYSRNQDGGSRGGQGGYNRNQDGGSRGGQGSYGRGQDGGSRGGQGSRGMSIPKPSGDTKPLEKESRKRTERGDRNRADKGEKLDRMEKNVRPGQKNNQRNNQKNASKKGQPTAPAPKPAEKPAETIRTLMLPEKMTISELAEAMKMQASAIIKKLFLQGTIVTVNQEIDFDKAEEIALEFNCICEKEEKVDVIGELLKEEEEKEDLMIPRPPVVCVMGHVDHGKTSLLDAIRHTHVIDKEAGGITQHIGAYVVSINGQKITFLDTPGHEAFTAMRMRGANSTDIAILVVAADDGVMPQTIEAINHAKAAGIEIIVAINKIDKPSANIERVKQELSEYELIPEDWGGSTVMVPVSAHTHEGIDNLLEMILLTAEVLELKANPDRKARGLVIEAELDKGKGPVATVLVQKGTLHVGDPIAAGACHGKIRAMMDDKGRRVKQAGPSTPVEVLGLSDVPNAGEIFICMDSEKEARSFAETFISEGRERMLEDTKMRMSLDDLYSQIQAGKLKELDLIVKADVQGSVEAVKQSLLKLSNEEVVVKVIHSGVGAINESDVILASASNAIIIGFNVRPDVMAKTTAERENVDVRLYRVIYDAIADVEAAMKGMLDPIYEEKIIGHAEIRQLFKASGVGTIAGSYVLDGIFQRNCKVRITREDKLIYEGALASLKRFKDDVKEVRAGFECGFVFEKFNDIKEEDKVEAYVMVEVPR